MASRDEIVAQLQAEEKALRERLERLRKPVIQAEEDLQHILGTIAFYQRNRLGDVGSVVLGEVSIASELKLRGMTHSQAVVAIAKQNGGVIRAQDVKRMMIKAGIMSQTKNSTNMAHNAILRTDLFERIAPGEYRLKQAESKVAGNGQMFHVPVQ